MKSVFHLIAVVLSAFLLILSAEDSAAQSGNIVSVDVKDMSLSEVLKSISVQSDYRFVYSSSAINASRKVSVRVRSQDINKVLEAVLDGTGISWTIIGNQIALSAEVRKNAVTDNPKKGTRTIRGKVFDSGGEALSGADVFVDGTTNGAVTDLDGSFTLIVPDDPETVLVYNFIGMKQMKTELGDRQTFNVTLTMDTEYLEQVVVTGYQTISRERSAGSFAKVEGAALQDRGNVHGDVLRGLEGSVAGLNVNTTAEGTQYLIRGVTSINSSKEPLYIVDGVPMSREQVGRLINPNDVSEVTFLKDATAASIWGAQAANGVMVITTKTGSDNGRLSINYSGTFTYRGKPDYSYQDMMTSAEFIAAAAEVFDPETYDWDDIRKTNYGTSAYFPVIYPHEEALYGYYLGNISYAEREEMLGRLSRSDGRGAYEKYFMSDAFLTNHSLSLSGGSDRNTYYVSLEYQGEQGTQQERSNEYKVYMRDMLNLTDWMRLDLSLNAYYSQSRSHLTSYDDDGIDHLTRLPYALYHDENGREVSFTRYYMGDDTRLKTEGLTGIGLDYHPVSDWNSSTNTVNSYSVRANAGLEIDIIDGLTYEGRFQYMVDNSVGEAFYPVETFKVRLERAYATNLDGQQFLPSSGGRFTVTDSYNRSYTVRNQLGYDKEFSGKTSHRVTALAGFEFSSNKTSSHSSFLRGYDMQTMQYIAYDDFLLNRTGVLRPALPMMAGATANMFEPNSYGQSEMEYRFISAYANAAYTLMDRYSVNASVRVDQSNLFGSDPSVQFKPIWSVGGIWNMAKEDFLSGVSGVDNLNLRISYGFAGNSPDPGEGGPFDILSSVSDPTYDRFGLGYVVATPANDKLTWEKTRTWNVGVDFSFLSNRLYGSLDLYDKYTTNLLASTPVDPTTGFVSVLSNIGTMTNRGVELSLSSVNMRTRGFSWSTDFNITYNRNKLVSMYIAPPETPSSMTGYEYWEGYPYGTVFAYKWAGLDPSDGMSRVYGPDGKPVRSMTDLKNASDVPYMGTTIPPLFGSLSNTFRYRGFQLSFMFIFNAGHVMRNDVNTTFSYRLSGNLHKDFALRWRKSGDEKTTDVPAYYKLSDTSINEGDVMGLYRNADINVLDASYIKLRDVSLAYDLPQRACNAIHAQTASVRLQVSDLWVIPFNSEGIDPEAFYLSGGARGEKFKPYFTVGLNIGF